MSLLAIQDLHTHFITRDLANRRQVARALNGISLELEAGDILGLVGETGAGKSLLVQSVLGLLRPPARVVAGQAVFDGRDLLGMSESERNALRGAELALVVQNPKASLDPLATVGDQLVRMQLAHRRVGKGEAKARALATMAAVGIPAPERRFHTYPHELSGGMAQRALIAMALINEPRLLIADEPTTGLDVTVQAQILDLLRELVARTRAGAIIITHDLGIVAHYCDRAAVMFAGTIVEQGPVKGLFADPRHPLHPSAHRQHARKAEARQRCTLVGGRAARSASAAGRLLVP